MEKVMEFLRDKFYYVIGIFAVLVIVLIFVFSCSTNTSSNNYEKIEEKMIVAATKYYSDHKKELPSEENDVVSMKINYLIANKYMKEIKNPKNKDELCSGKIETVKRGDGYKHTAFLDCGKDYETKLLGEAVKKSLKLDNKGNGLYVNGEEFLFRGENVKNYVMFNDDLWRVIKVDSEGDVKLIKNQINKETYTWDDRYNINSEGKDGINNFDLSRLKDTLEKYYKTHFNTVEGAKESIVKKDFCTGTRGIKDDIKGTAECAKTTSLYVGLIHVSEFYMSSLDPKCTAFGQEQCSNYNFLANNSTSSWTLTGSKEKDYRVFSYYDDVYEVNASNDSRIYPVIYLDSRSTVTAGDGTYTNPYKVK